MLPLYKIFSLILRIFTRPLINYTKKYHIGNKDDSHHLLKKMFKYLGNVYHRQENKINRTFLKISTPDELFVKPLADDIAIEKGVEFFYEIIFYTILITIPLWEMYKAQVSAEEKSQKLTKRLETVESNILLLQKKEEEDHNILISRLDIVENTLADSTKISTDIAKEFNYLRQDILNIINKKKI